MNILNRYICPDATYIRVGDIEPEIASDDLLMTHGHGTRRGWGQPAAGHEAVLNSVALTSVVVWWTSKHAAGQAWRHYRNDAGGWRRITWAHLTDYEHQTILDAYSHAPSWIKSPGKLASQRSKPRQHERLERDEQGAIVGYKWLDVVVTSDGQQHFRSPTAFDFWEDNELTSDLIPTEHNTNGIYAAKTSNSPELTFYRADGRRLVRLLLSGTVVEGQFGLRAEHAQIMEVLP